MIHSLASIVTRKRGCALTSRTTRGFTLLELLIALAIIGVLAGMTVSVMVRSRHRARATACVNNMRQLGIALQMYAADWAGCVPPYTTATRDRYMIGRGEQPEFVNITPFNDRRALKACFAPYDAHYDELWRCPLHSDDPSDEDYEPETTYRVSTVFTTQRPMKLDAPPIIPLDAYERLEEEGRQPGLFYFPAGDDPHFYLACASAYVSGDVPQPYTIPHGVTYPVVLLDGSVIQLRARY